MSVERYKTSKAYGPQKVTDKRVLQLAREYFKARRKTAKANINDEETWNLRKKHRELGSAFSTALELGK